MRLTSDMIKRVVSSPEPFGNQMLYEICEKYPQHKDQDVVIGKIWLIGRAYSAALERKKPQGITTAELIGKVANGLVQRGLDGHLQKLKNVRIVEADNLEVIGQILETHYLFVEVAQKFSKLNKRSLASKYLHFHMPNCFFLFDSNAYNGLVQLKDDIHYSKPPKSLLSGKFDSNYASFFFRMLDFRKHILDNYKDNYKRELTPRQLDRLLLGY